MLIKIKIIFTLILHMSGERNPIGQWLPIGVYLLHPPTQKNTRRDYGRYLEILGTT